MKNFSDFSLPKQLADSLVHMQFSTPTPIQAQAIPPALAGSDILGSAQTGTGKTAAFMIPLLNKLLTDPGARGLVMTPTRELAGQVLDMTRKLMGPNSGIRCALLIGGEPMPKQFKQLHANPRLIIGTPGRIDDHCRRDKGLLAGTNFLVLDEADRMLDMGFTAQIDAILKYMPKERQTLMFSATFSDAIIGFTRKYLNNPVRVAIKSDQVSADKIKHDVIHVSGEAKFKMLQQQLDERQGSVIVFVKTKRAADQMATRLSRSEEGDYEAEAIHGDLRQRQRDRTIRDFRSSRFRILVATDVASRGLDIPHIEHVINYDLPQNPEDYIHRIGRTARAGAEGAAVCFVTPQDGRNWHVIQRLVFPGQAPANSSFRPEGGRGGDRRRSGPSEGRGGDFKKKRPFNKGASSGHRSEGESRYRPAREGSGEGAKFGEFKPRRTPREDGGNGARSEYVTPRQPREESGNGQRSDHFKPRQPREEHGNGGNSNRNDHFKPRQPREDGERNGNFKPRQPREDAGNTTGHGDRFKPRHPGSKPADGNSPRGSFADSKTKRPFQKKPFRKPFKAA